tara:strand:+ start:490 stop:1002 length:513 start_codon:yes stop_codon:yes gene_type:complete
MSKKLITDELINERLEAKGFGEKQINDEDLAKESVLKHFGVEFTDDYSSNADFYVYEESTADGYSVFIATYDQNRVNVNENVYYYDSDLGEALEEYIKYSNGDEDNPEIIYVDDLHQQFIDDAIEQLFEYLAERFEEEVIDELKDEGYVYDDPKIKTTAELINEVNNMLS